jgi:hypothetical protein
MRTLAAIVIGVALFTSAPMAFAQGELLRAWEFNKDGDAEGWFPAHSLSPFVVEGGVLKTHAIGPDPYMHASQGRAFDIQGNDFQYIEIRMKCHVGESAEYFWANTVEGKDYGFVAGKERSFSTIPDGEFHTYRVFPLWEGQVTRLRFDPVDNDSIEIDYIRIYQLPTRAPAGPKTAWEFNTDGDAEGVIPLRDLDLLRIQGGGARTAAVGKAPTLLTSPTEIDAAKAPYVSVSMSSTAPAEGRVQWNTTGKPDFAANDSVSFDIVGDGKVHVYNLNVGELRAWQGTIKRLELSAAAPMGAEASLVGAQWAIDFIRCAAQPQGPADLRLTRISVVPTVGLTGEPIAIEAAFRNHGGEPSAEASCSLVLPAGVSLSGGEPTQHLGRVSPGQEATAKWQVVVPKDRSGTFEATLRAELGAGPAVSGKVPIRSYPGSAVAPPARVYAELRGDVAVIGNERIQAAIPTIGECPLFLYARDGNGWRNLGRAASLAELALAHEGVVALHPEGARLRKGLSDEAGVELRFRAEGASVSVSVSARPDDPALTVSETLTADRDLSIAYLRGAWLLAGDGTFGSALDLGLFPGLEYLVSGERSSSTLDIAAPNNLRYAPHPNRVTVPTMAIENDRYVVGIRWDPLQVWTPQKKGPAAHNRPTAVFASPDFLDHSDNHLMGLMLPSIPDFVREDTLTSQKGYALKRGAKVALRYDIFAPPGDVLAATDWVYNAERVPALPDKARSDAATVRLALRGYEELLWNEETQAWAGVKGWAATSKAGTAIYLYTASELYPNDPAAKEWRAKAIRVGKPDFGLDFAFHVGGVAQAVKKLRAAAYGTMAGQGADGGWTFHPDEEHAALGTAGEEAVGLSAAQTAQILTCARITGDPVALESGLRALQYMDQFTVPRASQVWEVPVHTPDILASSRTAAAYLEGYRITGERKYLDRAVYWARTGLPFVYSWQAPEIDPVMLYGTIPVFGATWYTGSWFGRIVQWNGLDYAGTLIDLARYDDSLPWRHIAEGINISGINQMQTKEGYQGLYPDSYGMTDNTLAWGLMLSSGRILHNMFALAGHDPSVQTEVVPTKAGRLDLSSAAQLSDVKWSEDAGAIDAKLSYRRGETFYSLLTPVAEPKRVLKNGKALARAEDLDGVTEGWMLDEGSGMLIIKTTDTGPTQLRIEGVTVRFPPQTTSGDFNRDGDPEGWSAGHAMSPVQVSGGMLRSRVIAEDPWLYGPATLIDAGKLKTLAIRMRLTAGEGGQVFWAIPGGGMAPERSATFPLQGDGQFHEYTIDLAKAPSWKGYVVQLRIDPGSAVGAEVEIDYVHLQP